MTRQDLGFAPDVHRTIWLSFAITLAAQPLSHLLSTALCETYRAKPIKQMEWNTRVVSSVHAIIASVLSAYVMYRDGWPMFQDMAYNSPLAAHTIAITSGYLMGDLLLVLLSLKPWGKGNISSPVDTCIHHMLGVVSFIACIYCRSAYIYSLIFIFTEVSTPFVNLRWFLHESGMADSGIYLVNGVLMVFSFFMARVFLLPWQWYIVVTNLKQTSELGSPWLAGQAFFGLVAATCLNLLWFSKMVKGLRKMMTMMSKKGDNKAD